MQSLVFDLNITSRDLCQAWHYGMVEQLHGRQQDAVVRRALDHVDGLSLLTRGMNWIAKKQSPIWLKGEKIR